MAAHRAVALANTELSHKAGPTLLVTYNKALVGYIRHLMGQDASHITVETFHKFAMGYLGGLGLAGWNIIPKPAIRDAMMSAAIVQVRDSGRFRASPFFDRPLSFFFDELDWLWGWGVDDPETYLAAERRGRLRPLGAAAREAVWAIREAYLGFRAQNGYLRDWAELASVVNDAVENDNRDRRYRHVVIDEGQDLPPLALRALTKVIDTPGSVTMFADYAQQLYGRHASYTQSGLQIRRAEEFKENYRNSAGIARLAIATAALPHFTQHADLVEPVAPTFDGPAPTLLHAASPTAAREVLTRQAAALARTGTVAILATTAHEAAHYIPHGLTSHPLKDEQGWAPTAGLHHGTYYSAKGLEFDAVIMPAVDASRFPAPAGIEALGEAEASERSARLLYVGVTRAKSELIASFTEDLTPLLPSPNSGLWAVVEA